MRIILPLLLMFSLTAYADTNIDKTLSSISDSIAPVDRVTGKRNLNVTSREDQIQQSNDAADQIIQQKYIDAGKPINEDVDAEQYQRLQEIFNRVHSVSHLSEENWKAYLLPDKTWNAFTMGGTYIFVYKGLMDDLKSDDELAAVIGHEIAHVSANHIYKQSAYTLAARLRGSKGVKKQSFRAAFTMKNEEEADEIGTLYATLAGYDPFAASRIWKRMYNNQGDYSARLIDHPINSERYKKTEELAQEYKQYYIPGSINPNHAAILQAVFNPDAQQQQIASETPGGGFLAALQTATDVMSKHYEVKAEELNQQATQQFMQYVSRLTAVTNKVAIDHHMLRVYLTYKGAYPIRNLNIQVSIGGETATVNNPTLGAIIPPLANFSAVFKFPAIDLASVNTNAISVQIIHAEMLQN